MNPSYAQLSKKESLTPKVFLMEFTPINSLVTNPLAGQFITVVINPQTRRSYSLCSFSKENNTFSLVVDTTPGGPGSQFFEKIQVGEKMDYIGPVGKFTLASETGNLVFIATGTGISPLKAMIDYLLTKQAMQNDAEKRKIYLIFGFRYQEDIFWKDYFEKLAMLNKNFFFTLTLSRPGANWLGNCGYVENYISSEIKQDPQTHFYICGGRAMVEGTVNCLKEDQIPAERIHLEPF